MDTFAIVAVSVCTFVSACWLLYECWLNVQERMASEEPLADIAVPDWLRKGETQPRKLPTPTLAQGESATSPCGNEPVPIFHRRALAGTARSVRRSA